MIWLAGDFPAWLPIFTLVGGITTALIIGGLAAAAAGGLATTIKAGIEGNWPWDDPAAWLLDHLKGELGGIGSVISAAKGDTSIQSALKGEGGGTSRGGGTGGNLQAATGQGPLQAANAALAGGGAPVPPAQLGAGSYGRQGEQMGPPRPDVPQGGVGAFGQGGEGGGYQGAPAGQAGLGRFDAEEAAGKPDRGKILGQAAKGVGIQAGITAAASLIPYLGSVIGPTVGAAAGSIAPVIGETLEAAAPPLLAAAGPTAGELTASLAQPLAGTLLPSVAGAAPPLLSAAGPAAPGVISSTLDAARHALQIVPDTIGDTASGILQSGVYGAGKGALSAGLNSIGGDSGQKPGSSILQGALAGGAGGLVSGGFNAGMSPFASPSQYQMINSPMPSAVQAGWSPGAPSLGYMAGSQAASPLGGLASAGVNELMTPQPPQPPQPTYRRPTYADVYDIGGDQVPYASRPPWWG